MRTRQCLCADFFFSSRRRHTRLQGDWSSDVCSSDLEVTLPAFVSIASLERALKLDKQKLRALNPALLRAVWDGQRQVPKAYHLRLPIEIGRASCRESVDLGGRRII